MRRSVMASSMKLEYPLNDALPVIEHTRDRLLAKIFDFRKNGDPDDVATDEDYELLYAYGKFRISRIGRGALANLTCLHSVGHRSNRAGHCVLGTRHRAAVWCAERRQPQTSVSVDTSYRGKWMCLGRITVLLKTSITLLPASFSAKTHAFLEGRKMPRQWRSAKREARMTSSIAEGRASRRPQ